MFMVSNRDIRASYESGSHHDNGKVSSKQKNIFNQGLYHEEAAKKLRLSEIQENQNSYDLQISESERVSVDPISSKTKELED